MFKRCENIFCQRLFYCRGGEKAPNGKKYCSEYCKIKMINYNKQKLEKQNGCKK